MNCVTDENQKEQVGNDKKEAQSEWNSHYKNRVGKTKLSIKYLYLEKNIISRMNSYFLEKKPNGQLFPNRWPLSYPNN